MTEPSLPAGIPAPLATALAGQGYETLTDVQLAMLDEGRAEADLLVSAQTGSGKTVAFGLAIAPTLLGDAQQFDQASTPLGLVIAPTRELAMQVERELAWLYAGAGIRIATCVGGMDTRTERRALERGAHLVVGTPGRLRDHITRGALDLGDIRAVVLDEADEMLDLGFREDLEFILGAAPEERRTLMFSATVPRAIAELAKTFQHDAQRVAVSAATEQHADIDYQVMVVHRDDREHAIINTLLYSDSRSAIVFCHTREAVRHLTARLSNRGFSVVALSGELAQSERSSALQAMRDGRAHVCVATDVAARGIDLPNLDLVVHADLPGNPDTLLHRSGRTGRAGRKGMAVLIVPEHRRTAANRVLSLARLSATLTTAPTISAIEERYRRQIIDTAAAAPLPDESEADFVAELLQKLTPEQLGAAYFRQQLAVRPVPEDVTEVALPAGKPPKRDKRVERDGAAPGARSGGFEREQRESRPPRMEGGVWFTLSLGRKHRADPKWLLPMICKAGGVTKGEVGSIKIEDTETRFEIAADAAEEFASNLQRGRGLEKGITIVPAGGEPRSTSAPRSKPKFRDNGAKDSRPPTQRAKKPYRPEAASQATSTKPKARSPKKPGKGKPTKS